MIRERAEEWISNNPPRERIVDHKIVQSYCREYPIIRDLLAENARLTTAIKKAVEDERDTRWIKVTDRLPLEQKDVVNYKTVDVIGCTRNNEVYNMEFAMGNTNGNQWHGFDDCVDGYVTHWMPLPDPPAIRSRNQP